MKKVFLTFFAFTAVLFAQSPERVQAELRRTDQVIELVRVVVEPSGNQEAQGLLAQAIEIQRNAWEGYRRHRYRWAYERTIAARLRAWQARGLVENSPERVRAEVERTEELMREAEPIVKRIDDLQVAELWRIAQSEQAIARDNLRNRRLRAALRFTLAARLHLGALLKLLRGRVAPERVSAELERTERVLEEAGRAIQASGNVRAREMFARAGEWQVRARNRFRARRYGEALRLTLACRDLALRGWRMSGGDVEPGLVEAVLSEAAALIESWADTIERQGDEQARQLLNQAQECYRRALEFKNSGDRAAAFEQATEARRLMNRALEALESGPAGNE